MEKVAPGIDMVLITGAATNGCCESTARDAMMLDFKVIMLSDACAAFTDAMMSRTPARTAGWFATMPTGRPLSRANPTMMLSA